MKTALEILNTKIDFSQDGVIDRAKAIEAIEEYASQFRPEITDEEIEKGAKIWFNEKPKRGEIREKNLLFMVLNGCATLSSNLL